MFAASSSADRALQVAKGRPLFLQRSTSQLGPYLSTLRSRQSGSPFCFQVPWVTRTA